MYRKRQKGELIKLQSVTKVKDTLGRVKTCHIKR